MKPGDLVDKSGPDKVLPCSIGAKQVPTCLMMHSILSADSSLAKDTGCLSSHSFLNALHIYVPIYLCHNKRYFNLYLNRHYMFIQQL